MSENRCVCCGEIIPEGRQVCIGCWNKAQKAEGGLNHDRMHRENGGRLVCKVFNRGWSAFAFNNPHRARHYGQMHW